MGLNIKNQQGFTVIEVVVSMVILVIMAAAFVTVFGTGFVNIFSAGSKNEAMTIASGNLEELYARQPLSASEIKTYLSGENGNLVDLSALYDYEKDDAFNFTVEPVTAYTGTPDVSGSIVKIVVFYRGGERHVMLSSFIREELD